MNKFAVVSGFLGSGKTTLMMALTRYHSEHFGKAAMISNDLGHGVNLADNRYAQLCGCNASEMTDECICYQNENLADRLNSYYDGVSTIMTSIFSKATISCLKAWHTTHMSSKTKKLQ